jgi:hypothetical protein
MDVFKILSKFKEDDNSNIVTYKGKDLTTLIRTEISQIADSVEFQTVDVAKVANIEAKTLNLVKLLNSALHVFNESSEHATKKKKKID